MNIKIKLDRERSLKYDLNSMCIIDEHGGMDEAKLSSPAGLRLMLYAGLVHEDPDLTLEQVGAMVDIRQLEEISEAVGKALNRDMAPSGQAEQARPQKARKRA